MHNPKVSQPRSDQWYLVISGQSNEALICSPLQVIVQFQPSSMPDEWGTTQDGQTRPRVVKRGIDDDHDEVPDGK